MNTLVEVKSSINEVIDNSKYYKNCYFWTPYGNAASRRSREFEIEFSFVHNNQEISVSQSLSISCRNFYFHTDIRRDGKKSNITFLKNALANA